MAYYKLLCCFRIILVFMPQTGYIHPDEHFQGPEITYGDIAGYDVLRTWEFISPKPIRSVVFPYTVTGIPAFIMCLLTYLQYKPGTYLLVTLPRLIMCMLSFLQDFCIYNICVTMKKNHRPCLTLFASSYVTLVYLTRTFSNSIESLFFAFMILLLSNMLQCQNALYDKAAPILFRRYMFYSYMFGVVLALGCFNRPTFICFATPSLIILSCMLLKMDMYKKMNISIALILGFLSISICLTLVDSFYYNKVNYSSIYLCSNIVCTPLNFVLYNLNTKNLSSHGLHSRWLHIFINIPLLFSIYGIVLLLYLRKSFSFLKNFHLNSKMILVSCFFIPLFILSLIPHQEPRFIIPLIVPLCLLFGDRNLKSYLSKKTFTYIWIISNILCVIFYGFIHQAGVYISLQYINSQTVNNSALIFYKTYMPPRYLLSLASGQNISVFDFAGCEEVEFESRIQDITIKYMPSKIFIVLPCEMVSSSISFKTLSKQRYKVVNRIHLFPHLSTENLPKFTDILYILRSKSSYFRKLYDLKELFSIHIFIFQKS